MKRAIVLTIVAMSVPVQALVVAPDARCEKRAGGFTFTEGPAVDAQGNIFFSDIPNNRIHTWSVDGVLTTFREDTGGANGLYFDKAGNLVACEGKGRRLVRISPQGQLTVLAGQYNGKRFNSLNDLWIDPKGGVYFTDPRYGAKRDDMEQDGEHVYYLGPDHKTVTRVINDLVRPNGVLGTPDGKTLYVADHGDNKTFAYAVREDGTLADKRLFAPEGSDGLTLDEQGNLYLTTKAVQVYSARGTLIETIQVPEQPSNVCFGGRDGKTLFITARTSLYSVRMQVRGMYAPDTTSRASTFDVRQQSFGRTEDGKPVTLYTLSHSKGMRVGVMDFGAYLVSLQVPDRQGRIDDIILGFDTLDGYLTGNYGAVIGRFANRIAQGRFTLDGKVYELAKNSGPNHIHGGVKGFGKVLWKGRVVRAEDRIGVEFSYVSRDSEEGYPGNLSCNVTYWLVGGDELRIHYRASTDKPTVINLTNHAFFNLSGAGSGTIKDHVLMLKAGAYTVVDDGLIPTGEIRGVKGTVFDFLQPRVIGDRIGELTQTRGYDHNFVVDGWDGKLLKVGELYDPKTGRVLELSTTEPGVQIYTGNNIRSVQGRQGRMYDQHTGVCLETQHFPDSPNHPSFPTTVLRPGEAFDSTTVFRFSRRQ